MIDILHIFVTIVCSLQNSKRRNMSEPETLNYQETLAIIETFMIKSGLRDFCTTVCQGQCCKHCIKNNSCFENEGKRLPCSLYICRDIKLHLGSTSSKFFQILSCNKIQSLENSIIQLQEIQILMIIFTSDHRAIK